MTILRVILPLTFLAACDVAEAPIEPVVDANQSSPATEVAEAACRQALADRAGQPLPDTRVDNVLLGEAGTGVWMSIAGSDVQWSCLSDAAGNVQGLAEAPRP